jgi:hypothetical protein
LCRNCECQRFFVESAGKKGMNSKTLVFRLLFAYNKMRWCLLLGRVARANGQPKIF